MGVKNSCRRGAPQRRLGEPTLWTPAKEEQCGWQADLISGVTACQVHLYGSAYQPGRF